MLVDGRLFGTPDPASVTVSVAGTSMQNFVLPDSGKLQVTVKDESSNPIPAKVHLVGFDVSADPLVTQSVLGVVNNTTGLFGEQIEDGLGYGIAFAGFADRTGAQGTVEIEPGSYQLVVSHGPRYSAFTQNGTITAGSSTSMNAQITRVINTPGFIAGDFHVHSINSPDCEVAQAERVATMLAEGKEAPPGTPMPSSAPLTAADMAPPPATVLGPGEARPLRLLAAEATAVVLADVHRTELFDEGKLHVHRLHVVRVLRGRLDDPEPAVVDIRGDTQRPALLNDGERAVVLLKPAPAYSYLTKHLPLGVKPWALVAERGGVVPVGGNAEGEAVERALAAGAGIADLDEASALAARRRLAFAELGGPSARLVSDGVAELGLLPALPPLASGELGIIARVLHEGTVEAATRVRLITLLADRGATAALPALAAAAADTPAVLDALFAARARLDAPPPRAELAGLLSGDDPAMRATAVRALARLDDPDALAEVGRLATSDKEASVRAAAVEALGATHRPTVLPVLARTFDDPSRDVMQKSARAMIEIGGPATDDTLLRLALKAGSSDTQRYAALVLLVTHGRDSPVVRQLEALNPSPEVRKVLEHGLEFHDTHRHE